jgi:hypothetical protein
MIRQTGDDFFSYGAVKGQKVIKLAERSTPGFCDMNGRGAVLGGKSDRMPVTNLFDRTDSLCFQKIFEFIDPGG